MDAKLSSEARQCCFQAQDLVTPTEHHHSPNTPTNQACQQQSAVAELYELLKQHQMRQQHKAQESADDTSATTLPFQPTEPCSEQRYPTPAHARAHCGPRVIRVIHLPAAYNTYSSVPPAQSPRFAYPLHAECRPLRPLRVVHVASGRYPPVMYAGLQGTPNVAEQLDVMRQHSLAESHHNFQATPYVAACESPRSVRRASVPAECTTVMRRCEAPPATMWCTQQGPSSGTPQAPSTECFSFEQACGGRKRKSDECLDTTPYLFNEAQQTPTPVPWGPPEGPVTDTLPWLFGDPFDIPLDDLPEEQPAKRFRCTPVSQNGSCAGALTGPFPGPFPGPLEEGRRSGLGQFDLEAALDCIFDTPHPAEELLFAGLDVDGCSI